MILSADRHTAPPLEGYRPHLEARLLSQTGVFGAYLEATSVAFATELGAETVLSGRPLAADVVFVGRDETLACAIEVCRTAGSIVSCGHAGDTAQVGWLRMAPG